MLLRPARSLTRTRRAVAHGLAGSMCSKLRATLHGVDVHAALVGEGGAADPGLAGVVAEVGDSSTYSESSLSLQGGFGQARRVQFEGEIGDDGGEVAVAGAFAVAVDGALDLGGAGEGGQGVGHAQADVVVGVDAQTGGAQAPGTPR
jgi:hypothetical protein